MNRNEEQWIELYQQLGALWIHGGKPAQPHALLTSGMHSSGFFNSGLVTEHPSRLDVAAQDLVTLIIEHYRAYVPTSSHPSFAHRVVGPAMGAITLAHDIARRLNTTLSNRTHCSYAEKNGDAMIFKRNPVHSGEKVIVCEDVITTTRTVQKVVDAVTMAGGQVLPYIVALVNRSSLTELDGRKIIALINRPMPTWSAEECPLCAGGSEAIRPKESNNWERLNLNY